MVMKTILNTRLLLGGLVILLLLLSVIPTPGRPAIEGILDTAGLGAVKDGASGYIHTQRELALKGFLLLSGLKVTLAVLRSSEIGLILNVRVGDLAVAVYDYVDFAWRVLLGAVAYFYLAEYFLKLVGEVDVWFLRAALISGGFSLLLASLMPGRLRLRGALGRTGRVCGVFALVLYLALPLSFVGAGWVSAHITGGPIEEANRVLEDTRHHMPGLAREQEGNRASPRASDLATPSVTVPFPYDGSDPSRVLTENGPEGVMSQQETGVSLTREGLGRLKGYLEERSRTLASAVFRQTSAYLFNIILLPVLSLVLLYWGARFLLSLSSPAVTSRSGVL